MSLTQEIAACSLCTYILWVNCKMNKKQGNQNHMCVTITHYNIQCQIISKRSSCCMFNISIIYICLFKYYFCTVKLQFDYIFLFQILTLCHEILSFDAAELVWTPCPPVVYTQSYANILLECLKDTYENNKMLALRLLITFPAEALGLDVSSFQFICLPVICHHLNTM